MCPLSFKKNPHHISSIVSIIIIISIVGKNLLLLEEIPLLRALKTPFSASRGILTRHPARSRRTLLLFLLTHSNFIRPSHTPNKSFYDTSPFKSFLINHQSFFFLADSFSLPTPHTGKDFGMEKILVHLLSLGISKNTWARILLCEDIIFWFFVFVCRGVYYFTQKFLQNRMGLRRNDPNFLSPFWYPLFMCSSSASKVKVL